MCNRRVSWMLNTACRWERTAPSSHSSAERPQRPQRPHIIATPLDHHSPLLLQAACWLSRASHNRLKDTLQLLCTLNAGALLQAAAAAALPVLLALQRSVREAAAMARTGVVVTFLVLAMLAMGETAPSAPNCDSAASALLPCYPYVTGPDVKPPSDCCGGLSGLNTNSPTCLCQLITQLNGSAASDPTVNITKAFNLPKDCAITLKTSDCPALANLPLAPPAGVSPSVPKTTTPGPTAGGPGSGVQPGNDVSKLLPTSLMIGMAAASGVLVQALIF